MGENKDTLNNNNNLKSKINDFCDRLRDDKAFLTKVSIGVVAVLLLIIVIIAVATGNKKDPDQAGGQVVSGNEVVSETGTEANVSQEGTVEITEKVETVEGEEVVADSEEAANVDPTTQVNTLIDSYFNAMASGDTNAIATMKNGVAQEEAIKIEKKSQYIESFENLNVLSKDGPVANSYVAFVYYEIKFKDIATLAPGLTTLYICMNDQGLLQINDGELAEDVTEFIKNMASAEDVKAIFDRVEVKYSEATDADAQLKQFMESLPATLEQEVAQAMSESEAQQGGQEEPAQEAPAEETTQSVTETVKATDTVNVRSSDSETADKLGKVDAGTTLTRYEVKQNGWSRIDYDGKEAYIKSEFLSVVETTDNSETQTEENTAENNENAETTTTQTNVETVDGKIVVLETVNVRKSASETADRIGTAYQGEYYDLVMQQADGWTKIKFNGQVGFVKSEFVKK